MFFQFVELKKRRGRPRVSTVKKDSQRVDMDKILRGPSYPLELVTTKVGGMKAAFQNNCYEFHFNRNGNKFWRCLSHTSGCQSKIVSKGNTMYPVNVEHNHENQPFVFVETSDLIATKHSSTPSSARTLTDTTLSSEKLIEKLASKNTTPALTLHLREKMKKRLAALHGKNPKKQ